jgi:hypothetical protein
MGISSVPVGWEDDQDESGCAYLLDECDGRRICGAPRRAVAPSRKAVAPLRKAASPYCPEHHALCHAAYGSEAEADRLREVEAIAKVVGGRRSRDTAGPSRRFLKRLEEAARGSSWPDRS